MVPPSRAGVFDAFPLKPSRALGYGDLAVQPVGYALEHKPVMLG